MMNIQRCKKLCTKALVHGIYFLAGVSNLV